MPNDPLWKILKILPSDYSDYGGQVVRWQDANKNYPDCSCGCKFWRPLYNTITDSYDTDWGVCYNPHSPRAGLLTWEHQTGINCFEYSLDEPD